MNIISLKSDLIEGNIVCPGDKSISQRILILGWLLNKNITISGFLNAEDPISTANALNQISDSIQINGNEVIIKERTIEPKILKIQLFRQFWYWHEINIWFNFWLRIRSNLNWR